MYGVGSCEARVLGDVDEREVVAEERREQDAEATAAAPNAARSAFWAERARRLRRVAAA